MNETDLGMVCPWPGIRGSTQGGETLERGVQFQGAISVLINGWENWEPKDKSKKDALMTYWTKDKEEEKKMSSQKNRPQEKHWWEQEDKGYNTDRNLKAEYDWEDKTKRMIKERLGILEEETDDDRVSEIEGEKQQRRR